MSIQSGLCLQQFLFHRPANLAKILLCSRLERRRSGFTAAPRISYSATAYSSHKEDHDKMISGRNNHRHNSSNFNSASARRGGQAGRRNRDGRNFEQHSNTTTPRVPGKQYVVPGASVSIVLKEDQPTGRQVHGTVRDVLTRGDHPRGIKVRLSDGRIGRVQRMVSADEASGEDHSQGSAVTEASSVPGVTLNTTRRMEPDAVVGGSSRSASSLPLRTLADYMPQLDVDDEPVQQSDANEFTSATAVCPVCPFEGDEAAVSYHVGSHFR